MGWIWTNLEQYVDMILMTYELEGKICDRLSLTREEFRKMDLGDIERYMEDRGFSLRIVKCSPHPLYMTLGVDQRNYVYEQITKALNEGKK